MNKHFGKRLLALLSLALVLTMGLGILVFGETIASVEGGNSQIVGDVNGSQTVDAKDVVDLLLHISMPEQFPISVAADYTGEGTVDVEDAVYLLLHVSMPELFPLYNGQSYYAFCSECETEVLWRAFNGQEKTGHYVLMGDMELKHQLTIGAHDAPVHSLGTNCNHTENVVLDLNGYSITLGQKVERFASIYAGLTILDSSAEQTGKIIATQNDPKINGGLIRTYIGAELKLYGGELTAAETAAAGNGGLLYLEAGTLEMYGGKITGGTVAGAVRQDGNCEGGLGGNLYISKKAVANVYGGEISGGKAVAYVSETLDETEGGFGGNIYSEGQLSVGAADGSAEAVIKDGQACAGGNIYTTGNAVVEKTGVVTAGKAIPAYEGHEDYCGGNIYQAGKEKTLCVKGEVSDGVANWGGNIGAVDADVVIDGGEVLRGEAQYSHGGNICTFANNLYVKNNALIADGVATAARGGNICCRAGGELYLTDSTVSGGKAKTVGGNIYLWGQLLREGETDQETITGYDYSDGKIVNSVVSGGEAVTIGGNICAYGVDLEISGSEISGGIGSNGGNIYLAADRDSPAGDVFRSTMTITGGSRITDGKSTVTSQWGGGGNIYVGYSEVEITDCVISGGISGECGGNMLISHGNVTLGNGAVVKDGVIQPCADKHDHSGDNICKFNSGKLDIRKGASVIGGTGGNGNVFVSDATKSNGGVVISGEVLGDVRMATGSVSQVKGGTVSGVVQTGSTTIVSGAAKIGELVLTSGQLLNVIDLVDGAQIGVSAVGGVFTKPVVDGRAAQYAQYFCDVNGKLDCIVLDEQLAVGVMAPCAHCDGEEVLWAAFTEANAATTGHWIVVEDLSLKNQLAIGKCNNHGKENASCNHATDSVIDLNGHTITAGVGATGTGGASGRFALVYGNLTLMDSSSDEAGRIVAGRNQESTVSGGLILGSTESTFNLYGGTLENAGAYTAGNGGLVRANIFNMYGGKIVGGVAKENNGGNLYIAGTGNIYGGEILNGIANAKVIVTPAEGDTPEKTTYELGYGGNIYSAGELNIYGGVISGGTTENSIGGNIYVSKTLNLQSGATVSDGVARNGGNIGIASSGVANIYGTVTGGNATASGGGITGAGSSKINVIGGTVSGGTSGATGGNIQSNNGYITLSDGATVTGGTAGTNGGNIYTSHSAVGRTVTINDSTVSDGTAASMGGNVYVVGKKNVTQGVLNIIGSTISGGKACLGVTSGYVGGGNIYLSLADITTKDTTISGGEAGRFGGNMLASYSHVVLGAGTVVEGGKSVNVGNSIAKWNSGDLEILAGAVVKADSEGNGTVYMDNSVADVVTTLKLAGSTEVPVKMGTGGSSVAFEVSGAAKASDVSLGKWLPITVGNMTDGAQIKISDAGESVFANVVEAAGKAAEYAQYFSDVNEKTICVAVDDQLAFRKSNYCWHCSKTVAWTAFDPAVTTYTESAHVYLSGNVTLSKQLQVATEEAKFVDVIIDLNGYKITTANRFALVYGSLYIMDYSKNETGVITTQAKTESGLNGGLILAAAGSHINLYGGTLTVPAGNVASKGGVVYQAGGVFNMYGGTISGGTSNGGFGGNVYIAESATCNILGGVISGGTATGGKGGNVYTLGILNVDGGAVIRDGSAADGGNIYDDNEADITSGTIANGVATNQGGNIFHAQGNKKLLTIGADAIITGGEAVDGGNIFADYTITVYGTVTNGTASGKGGNIWHDATLVLGKSDGSVLAVVSGGTANLGGNIYNAYKLHAYKNTLITNGTASDKGGNIYSSGQETNLYSKVSNGTAGMGGNLYCTASTVVVIDGGEMISGTASYCGGNIYSSYGKVVLSNNAKVADGKTTESKSTSGSVYVGGGNIYSLGKSVANDYTLQISDSVVSGGVSAGYGGNIIASNCKIVLDSGAVVDGGKAAQAGASICKWNAGDLEILAGATVQADASGNGGIYMNNSGGAETAKLVVSGAVQVTITTDSSDAGLKIAVSGAPQIKKLELYSGLLITVGELSEGTDIVVSTAYSIFSTTFTEVMNPTSKASEYAKYFKNTSGKTATAKNGALQFKGLF